MGQEAIGEEYQQMTFGDLDKSIPSTEEEQHHWVSFDWTSESYQLMCREYRQSLGIVNMNSYECDYETESEIFYYVNFYNKRGYDDYTPKQVIADPPLEFEEEWVKQHGITIRTSENEEGPKDAQLTPEQQKIFDDFDTRFTEAKISVDGNDVIPDAALIKEFLRWIIANQWWYPLVETFGPSFAYLHKQKQEQRQRELQRVRELMTIIPGNSGPEVVEEEIPTRRQEQPQQKPITATTITTTKDKEPELVWSDARGGFMYR